MPNTLVHFAAQGAASRSLWRRLDPRWLYLGCLVPGCAPCDDETCHAALALALDLSVEPDERAVVRLAALNRLLAVEAAIDLRRPTVDDVARLLETSPLP